MYGMLSEERFHAFLTATAKYFSWESILADAGITEIADKDSQFEIACPFHEDWSPSMRLTKSNGVYHCFSCGRKGTYTKFLWELNGKNGTYSQYCEQVLRANPALQAELKFTSLFISSKTLSPEFNQRRIFKPEIKTHTEMPISVLASRLRKMDDSWNTLAVSLTLLQQEVPADGVLASMQKNHIEVRTPSKKVKVMDLLGD